MDTHPVPSTNQNTTRVTEVVSGLPPITLHELIEYDAMCSHAENKSEKTVEQTTLALGRLENFLKEKGLSSRAHDIGPREVRAFMLDLKV